MLTSTCKKHDTFWPCGEVRVLPIVIVVGSSGVEMVLWDSLSLVFERSWGFLESILFSFELRSRCFVAGRPIIDNMQPA